MAAKAVDQTLAKVPEDELIFVLREQDVTSPQVIVRWIELNIFTAPNEKLREALELAISMKDSTVVKKYAD